MFPIYIPSKGRAQNLKTARLLDGLSFDIVVEPQDVKAYRDAGYEQHILALPEDNKGLAYARNWIKEHSKWLGEKYHWQLDDDIKSFLYRADGKPVEHVCSFNALTIVETHVKKYSNIGQAGLNQNSWPPTTDIKINNLPVQAVLNNNAVCASYRDRQPLEDFDYTLQVLSEGWCTMMFDRLRTSCPVTGTNEGGLFETYQNKNKILRSMQAMVKDFPTLSLVQDDKGWHLKKNRIWSTFKQKPKTY